MKKVYISGPITNCVDFNKNAFIEAENLLKSKGFLTINPLRIFGIIGINNDNTIISETEYKKIKRKVFLQNNIKHLIECDHIYFLKNSESSTCVIIERWVAKELEIEEISFQ